MQPTVHCLLKLAATALVITAAEMVEEWPECTTIAVKLDTIKKSSATAKNSKGKNGPKLISWWEIFQPFKYKVRKKISGLVIKNE